MNVLPGMKHATNDDNNHFFVFSNPSQSPSQCTLPLAQDLSFEVYAPANACSWPSYTSAVMPIHNSGTVFLQDPCLTSSRQSFPTEQFNFQNVGLASEYFPNNLPEPQTSNNYTSTTKAASQALPGNELSIVAIGGLPPSTFDAHAIIGPHMQSSTSTFATNSSPCGPSPEATPRLPASPYHKGQRSECPLLNCGVTFKRLSDLKRHVDTIHGPKESCPYNFCRFKTGRKDKMLEHARKMHGKA